MQPAQRNTGADPERSLAGCAAGSTARRGPIARRAVDAARTLALMLLWPEPDSEPI